MSKQEEGGSTLEEVLAELKVEVEKLMVRRWH